MAEFRKQIQDEIDAMKSNYEGKIKKLETRIDTLEEDNARLQHQAKAGPAKAKSADIALLEQRVTELEETSATPRPELELAAKRAEQNAAAIKSIEAKLQADATETRDIYRDNGGMPFDVKEFFDLPQPFEFHGYLRSGFGMNSDGGKMEAFIAPGAGAKYRLGNEAETYGEIAFTHNWLRLDDPTLKPYVRTTVMMSYSTGENFSYDSLNNQAQGNDVALRQAFVEMGNVIEWAPDVRFWAGQRYYQRHDVHINDFYFLDMSGYGGGVEDIPVGGIGKLSLAWLGGSVDHYETPHGNVAKQNFDVRLTDVKAPLGKLSFWFDYAYTKGGDVINAIEEDGSKVHIQTANGWAAGLIHRTGEEAVFGGYNEFAIQYGRGAAYNFGSTLDFSGPDLRDAERFRVTDSVMIQPSPHFAMQAVGVYEDTKYGGADSRNRWISLGARPIYFFNDRFSVALEGGIDWDKSEPLGTNGHLWKITLAPQISLGNKFFSRPVLRAFVTYAGWSDGFKGYVGGTAFEHDTAGLTYGLQAETWW